MIELSDVSKKFGTGTYGLSSVTFSIDSGEFVFLVGPTGAGKTTIFRLLIRESLPSSGNIVVDQWDVVSIPNRKVPELRKKIGVVFQDLKLLLDRTIFENVLLPLDVVGLKGNEAADKVEDVLKQVGIIEHKDKFPVQLSGGELQRTAIARALVLSPDVLLADEPTGNLDPAASWEIVKLLSDINEKGTTVIMATHNVDIVKSLGKRVIRLEKGSVIKDDKEERKHKEKSAQSKSSSHEYLKQEAQIKAEEKKE